MIIGAFAMLIQVAAGFVIPYFMAIIIDDAIKTEDLNLLYETAGYMLLAALLGLVAGLFNNYNSQKIAIYGTADLRLDLFAKIQQLSFNNIDKFDVTTAIPNLKFGGWAKTISRNFCIDQVRKFKPTTGHLANDYP